MCGVFGIGDDRANDRDGLRRVYDHLEPGGAMILWHMYPYASLDESSWARWLPGHRADLPTPWREAGGRRRAADGDEIELIRRLAELDPVAQRHTLEVRARLWRDEALVREETYRLRENLYFAPEIKLLLNAAGFSDVEVEAAYEGRKATPEDDTVIFTARR